jgi:hypothetical protein
VTLSKVFVPFVSIAGLLVLSYVLGAAVVYFKWPTSAYLHDAFIGGEAWLEQQDTLAAAPIARPLQAINDVDEPSKTFDGFTLFTTDSGAQATLINMRGQVVHKWEAPFSRVWPNPQHVREPVPDDKIYLFCCHLYPDGSLLAVYHGTGDTPYGYGLAKIDKDSKVLWTYSANVHHAVDVGEDGTIYVLSHEIIHEMPRGLEYLHTPALVGNLVLLSPGGQELQKISLLEALRDSPYALYLGSRVGGDQVEWDILHSNSVEVLRSNLAQHFPLFKAGQVLISIRELDSIAVLDPKTRSIAWAAHGPWRGQHDPHFLANGRILIFDNRGCPKESRVLEYDPRTQACPWSYSSEGSPPFQSLMQGRSQRLPNGNTLIVNSQGGVLMEVTPGKELVWSLNCNTHMPWAHRYAANELSFLKGTQNARP